MFSNNRSSLRRTYHDAWAKAKAGEALEGLELIIAKTIELHPEYQQHIENPANIERDFFPEMNETNPYLHMGMHIAIHEQLSTNRPAGIMEMYQDAIARVGDVHAVEHRFMDCLGEAMWKAQRENCLPDEQAYMDCLGQI